MQRIQALDRARGFTVFFIPVVHSFLLYAEPSIFETPIGYALRFVAEGPGAQLFLFHMGFVFTLTQKSITTAIKRAAILLIAGFALNFAKFILPGSLGLLPASLIAELRVYNNLDGLWQLVFVGDILHVAGLSLFIIALIRRLPGFLYIIFSSVVVIVLCSGFVLAKTSFSISNYLAHLIAGEAPAVYFPLLPWLVYPLAGLLMGALYVKSSTSLMSVSFYSGTLLMLVAFVCLYLLKLNYGKSFYHTAPAGTCLHLGFILLWLSLCFWLSQKIRSNFLFSALEEASKKITLVYLIQWPLIMWCLPVFGMNRLDLYSSCITAFLISYLSFHLTNHFLRFKKKWKNWNK